MVEQGARRLILLGRTKLPPRSNWSSVETGSRVAHQIAAVRELEASGASVHLASVYVADEEQLSGYLDEFRSEGWSPIRGVVHAAGVIQDGLLVQLDAPQLNTVLRPKMMGAWLLHRLLKDAPLDFFVLFSSAGSLLGQAGQGNYAAANAFLDALAHHRKAQGQPAMSINWAPGAIWVLRIRRGGSASPRASPSWESGAWLPSKHWKCSNDCSGKTPVRSSRCPSTGNSTASFIRRAASYPYCLNLHMSKPTSRGKRTVREKKVG